MTTLAPQFPLGRPVVPAVSVRRRREVPPDSMLMVRAGERLQPNQVIAETMLADGTTGTTRAGLGGQVVEVVPGERVIIEGVATLIHGIVGIGATTAGPLVTLPRGESLAVVPIPRGGVILYPQQAPLTLLQRAAAGGAAAVIAASAAARELEAFARADLTAVLDGQTSVAAGTLTVVLTEGIGAHVMNPVIYQTLGQRLNEVVLCTGVTVPARNVRPEVLLSAPSGTQALAVPLDSALVAGASVIVRGGRRGGLRGVIAYVYQHPQLTPAGRAMAARVQFEDGSADSLPLTALDRIS